MRRLFALAAFLFPGIFLIAADKPAAPTLWTVEDVLSQEEVGAVDISPDGTRAVWVRLKPSREKDRRVSCLGLSWLKEDREIQITRGEHSDTAPRWSPDGRLIAFLSDRTEKKGAGEDKDDGEGSQIWLIDPAGGESWKLTSAWKGVKDFRWLDAGHLIFSAREDETLREKNLKERKDDSVVVEDREHFIPTRLFAADTAGEKIRRLTDNGDQIDEFAPSPDGRYVVTRHIVSPHYEAEANPKPKFYLYDLGTGGDEPVSRVEIFPDPLFFPYGFLWSRDGSGFYCLRDLSRDPEWRGAGVPTLHYFDRGKMSSREVPLEWPGGLSQGVGYDVTPDGLVASLAAGAVNRFARYRHAAGSWSREWITGERSDRVHRFKLGPDSRTLVFMHSRADTPPRWVSATIEGARLVVERPIFKINPHLDGKRNTRAGIVTWKGALDDTIEGILYYPLDYREGKRYPLVLQIHGGPDGVDLDRFVESWGGYPNILAARGAFVLMPNYHGSSNYGRKFLESIKGHYYEYEVPDILKGVDALIARGMVDPQRLGTMGWSNGAILTIQLLVVTDRFKAASPGAGEVNWISDFGNCSFGPQFDISYFGGTPWRIPRVYFDKSPLFRLERVTTPTLILHGSEDDSVPTEQGWQQFRALNMIGKAPVKFVLFPGEPHGLRKISHQRRKMEEELAWFDRYLFKTLPEASEALQENSPLDLALKGKGTAREGGHYGALRNGTLVPETVPWEKKELGRFEVTRAQYAAFDDSVRFDAATGDLPMTGVGLEEARAYCGWLGERTGAHYRLPAAAEMEKLAGKSDRDRESEITLDYWAGYDLTPDDAAGVLVRVKELGPLTRLLKPVGSARPVDLAADRTDGRGKEAVLVFDLDGNAAEWTDDGRTGKAMGGCASLPRDRKAPRNAPPPEIVGFRVVLEKQ